MPAPRFTDATLAFLRALERNNDREWFRERKAEYDRVVRQPMVEFIERLALDLPRFAPRSGRVAEGIAVPRLPRHAVLEGQAPAEDAHRRHLPAPGNQQAQRRRPVFPRPSGPGVHRRRRATHPTRASCTGCGSMSPTTCRNCWTSWRRRRFAGASGPWRRTAPARPVRVRERPSGGGVSQAEAAAGRLRAARQLRDRPARLQRAAAAVRAAGAAHRLPQRAAGGHAAAPGSAPAAPLTPTSRQMTCMG